MAVNAPVVVGHVVSSGAGFQVLEANVPAAANTQREQAAALSDGDQEPPVPGFHRTFALTSLAGVEQIALPPALKSELLAEYGRPGVPPEQVTFNTLLIDEAAAARAYERDTAPAVPGREQALGLCSKKHSEKSKGVSYALTPTRNSLPLDVGGFAGTYESIWNSSGQISLRVHYIQKSRCGITYGVEFDRVVAEGTLDLNGSEITYGGTVFNLPEQTIAEFSIIDLEQSYSFWIGPFMIVIGAGIDARAGLNVSAAVKARVGLRTPLTGRYSFIYECRESGCTSPRPPEHTLSALIADSQFVGELDARAKLEPWLDIRADVAGGLYTRKLRFAEIEVQGHIGVPATVWGYYGNLCGDGDGDGINETVSAATLDVNADVYMYVRASVLSKAWERAINLGLGAPWELLPEDAARSPRAKYTYRRNVWFRDFISDGSTALSPLVIANQNVSADAYQEASYTFRVRPCVPSLGSKMDYVVDWGTDGIATLQGPATGITVPHTWGEPGAQVLTAYLDRDSMGRDLRSAPTTRTISVEPRSTVNRAPVVDVGPDRVVAPGTLVTIAGTAYDPDKQSITYAWTQLGGPPITLSNVASSSASFTAPAISESAVTVQLTVTDSAGRSASDQVIVTSRTAVRPRPPVNECPGGNWPRRCIPR